MLPSFEYVSLLQYAPRGMADMSVRSREVRDAVKGGQIALYKERLAEILHQNSDKLTNFLHANVTLVPTPRSSSLRASALWPAQEIAEMLAALGLGTVNSCLVRATAVRKSALYAKADDRPSIEEHYDSFAVRKTKAAQNITLVDDVLTLGRTFLAAASRLAEAFPHSTIRGFALLQTKGRSDDGDINAILNVRVGTITYNTKTGKCKHT